MDQGRPEVGWFTYLSHGAHELPVLHPSATVHEVSEGVVIKAFEETLEPDNPEHVQIVSDIRLTLQQAGLLEPVRYWRN
jgi:hypothetical protein